MQSKRWYAVCRTPWSNGADVKRPSGVSQNPQARAGRACKEIWYRLPQPVRGSRPDRNQPCLVVVRAKAVGDSPLQQRLADVHSHYDTGRQLLREGRAPQAAIRQLEYCVLRDVLFAPAYERMAEAYDLIGLPGKEEELREQARFAHQKNWERKVEAELQSQSQRDPVGADITPAGMRFRSVV